MTYREEIRDLFSVSEDYYLAQCISADFDMKTSIEVEFDRRFDIKNKLIEKYTDWLEFWDFSEEQRGTCILEGRVFNLITKRNYWSKPSYHNIEKALHTMKVLAATNKVAKIAMPMIGSGSDMLNWKKVSVLVKQTFADTDTEILVCRLE
jgi:hypothetical protein